MTPNELRLLAQEVESSDPNDRNQQKRILERVCALREQSRRSNAPELAACLGAISELIEALTGARESIGRPTVRGLAGRMLFALSSDLGSLSLGQDRGPTTRPPEEQPVASQAPSAAPAPAPPRTAPPGPAPRPVPRAPKAPAAPGAGAARPVPPASPGPATPPVPRPGARPPQPPAERRQRKKADMAFGRMLVELGHVTRDQVAQALRFHRARGPRIGECFLLQGSISPDHLLNALKIQDLLRSTPQGITHEALARYKKADETSQVATGQAVPPHRPPDAAQRVTEGIFLGEVLLGADMITNEQLEKALHLHHHTGIRVGEALVKLGALTEEDVQNGLKLQRELRRIAGLRVA